VKFLTVVKISLGLIALFSAVELVLSTRYGPGVGGDATIYIISAKNLLSGAGLGLVGPQGEFRLLPYFPPLFPLALAAIGAFGADLTEAARWLNILMFAGLVYLSGRVMLRITRSPGLALILAFLVAVSPVLIPVYSWAMSEPLSLMLGFGSLGLLLDVLERGSLNRFIFLAGLAAGLSFLTRYSSAAFLAAGLAGLLVLWQVDWKKRLGGAAAYLVTGILPMAGWAAYDLARTSTLASRSLESGAETAFRVGSFWQNMKDVLLFWVVPDSWTINPPYPSSLNTLLAAGLVIFVTGWLLLVAWKLFGLLNMAYRDERFRMAVLLVFYMVCYMVMILAVSITTYPPITIGSRMLSPVHTAFLWLLVALSGFTVHLWEGNNRLKNLLSLALVLGVVWYGWRSARIVQQYSQTGLGYTAPAWRNSETIAALKQLPAGTILVSNETNAVEYLSGRPAYPLMEIYQVEPLPVFTRYGDGNLDGDEPQRLFREKGAALVLFDTVDGQFEGYYGPRTGERLSALVSGLDKLFRGSDGGIFKYPLK
jgi:4-amino-4-deoxy-L-arabinose transferase-like glycosyltransferase